MSLAIRVANQVQVMLKIKKQDLILRFDEEREMLQFLVPNKSSLKSELNIFFEVAMEPISQDNKLEQEIGSAVIAFLSATYRSKNIKISQYRKAGEAFAEELQASVPDLESNKTLDEEFEDAMLYLDRFDENWTIDDLENVTNLIYEVAERGSIKAQEYVENEWIDLYGVLKTRLARKKY